MLSVAEMIERGICPACAGKGTVPRDSEWWGPGRRNRCCACGGTGHGIAGPDGQGVGVLRPVLPRRRSSRAVLRRDWIRRQAEGREAEAVNCDFCFAPHPVWESQPNPSSTSTARAASASGWHATARHAMIEADDREGHGAPGHEESGDPEREFSRFASSRPR
jgi:hypothetical protein